MQKIRKRGDFIVDNKIIASNNDIVFYKKDNGDTNIELLINGETFWVSQKTMAEIFDIDRTVITKHLKNIFNEGELDRDSVCRKFRHTASDGKNYSCSNRISIDSAVLFWNFLMTSNKRSSLRIEYGRPIMHGRPNF